MDAKTLLMVGSLTMALPLACFAAADGSGDDEPQEQAAGQTPTPLRTLSSKPLPGGGGAGGAHAAGGHPGGTTSGGLTVYPTYGAVPRFDDGIGSVAQLTFRGNVIGTRMAMGFTAAGGDGLFLISAAPRAGAYCVYDVSIGATPAGPAVPAKKNPTACTWTHLQQMSVGFGTDKTKAYADSLCVLDHGKKYYLRFVLTAVPDGTKADCAAIFQPAGGFADSVYHQ